MMGLVGKFRWVTERKIHVMPRFPATRRQAYTVVGHVTQWQGLYGAHGSHGFPEIVSIEHIQQTILTGAQHHVAPRRNYGRSGAKVLIPVVVHGQRLTLRIFKRDE